MADDQSRDLLAATAYRRVFRARTLVASFIDDRQHHGLPAATLLTDNDRGLHARVTHGQKNSTTTSQTGGHPKNDTPATRKKPRQKSNASTKPSNAGLLHAHDRHTARHAKPCSTPSAALQHRSAHRALRPTPPRHRHTPHNQAAPPDAPNEHYRIRRDNGDACGKSPCVWQPHTSPRPSATPMKAPKKILILVTTETVSVLPHPGPAHRQPHHRSRPTTTWRTHKKNAPDDCQGNLNR